MLGRHLTGSRCEHQHHNQLISEYYDQIMGCIARAIDAYVPSKKCATDAVYNVPGWNDYVYEKHHEARSAYRDWIDDGKPRHGFFILSYTEDSSHLQTSIEILSSERRTVMGRRLCR